MARQLSIEDLLEPGLRDEAQRIFRSALEAVEPSRLVVRAFGGLPSALKDALAVRRGRTVVVGAGKAAGPMASALEDILADLKVAKGQTPPPPVEGMIVLKHGAPIPNLRRIQVYTAGHPVPDKDGLEAAEAMLALVAGLGPQDLLFALVSGGGSALLPAPPEGVSLEDLQATTDLLLKAGATIHELNAIRKHLSRLAGGQLARASKAAALLCFAISDVPGDRLDSVASGPTVPDESTFREAFAALRKHDLLEKVPAGVRSWLERGARGQIPETPKPDDKAFARARTVVIGSNRTALDAAAHHARERGFSPILLPGILAGDARKAGDDFAKKLLVLRERAPLALIGGGETVVKVAGDGKGGRSQELAIGAALALAGTPGVALLAGGTDGEDGPTDAAGAVVDGSTIGLARAAGADPDAFLARNDSYGFFERAGGHLKTGPTGTNVMDLAIGLITRRASEG